MRDLVTGEYLAQVRNPDPFAAPAWRSPVYRTPAWIIGIVQLGRSLWRLARFLIRHPITTTATAVLTVAWVYLGWATMIALVTVPALLLVVWGWRWPGSFSRYVATPARGKWRAWHYRRRWASVMTIGKLAVSYQGRLLLPALGKVTSTGYTD